MAVCLGSSARNAFGGAASWSVVLGSASDGMPPANLADPQPRLRARFADTPFALLGDAGAVMQVAAVFLGSTTIPASANIRLRGSVTDATGVAGDALDLTLTAGTTAAAQGQVLALVSPAVMLRYLRLDISLAADIGLLWAGPLIRLEKGIAGLTEGRVPLAQRTRNAVTGGDFALAAPYGDPRFVAGTLPHLTAAEAAGPIAELLAEVGAAGDVLLIPNDADSQAERQRRSIWGRMFTPGQAAGLTFSSRLRRALALRVEERL